MFKSCFCSSSKVCPDKSKFLHVDEHFQISYCWADSAFIRAGSSALLILILNILFWEYLIYTQHKYWWMVDTKTFILREGCTKSGRLRLKHDFEKCRKMCHFPLSGHFLVLCLLCYEYMTAETDLCPLVVVILYVFHCTYLNIGYVWFSEKYMWEKNYPSFNFT